MKSETSRWPYIESLSYCTRCVNAFCQCVMQVWAHCCIYTLSRRSPCVFLSTSWNNGMCFAGGSFAEKFKARCS